MDNNDELTEMTLTGQKKEDTLSTSTASAVIVRCVCAVVCTGIVCGSVNSCVGKLADTIKTAPSDDGVETTYTSDITLDDASLNIVEETTEAKAYTTDITVDMHTDTSAEQTISMDDYSEKATASHSKKELSTAEIIDKFNLASNKIKKDSKFIKQNYCENTKVSIPEINNNKIRNIADKLISANMGRDEEKNNATYITVADKEAYYPVSGQKYSSELTESDVKSAIITTSGNISTITIKVKDDVVPNTGTHAKKAFSVVTKENIIEGAGSLGMKFIKEESIGLSYTNGVIKVKLNEKTGNIISANYYIEWKLSLSTTVAGLDVGFTFGTEEDYTIIW